jgi:hypothetical protein
MGESRLAVKFYRCIPEGKREREDHIKEKNNSGYKPCSVVVGTSISFLCNITWCHDPEGLYTNLGCHGKLTSRSKY